MRLCIENTEPYLHALAASITRDPESLDAWHCLHIHPAGDALIELKSIIRTRDAHKDEDCDLVLCPDGDILLFSRELDSQTLYQRAGELVADLEDTAPELHSYDLERDWRRIRVLLSGKVNASVVPLKTELESADFGEVSSMRDILASAQRLRPHRDPAHVLVVDDDPLTRRIVAGAFKENFALLTAADAHEAVANYLFHAPDVVFLDINLPDANGFTVLRQILAVDPSAYVVMFSGNSYLDNVTKSLTAGACGFIAKPFKKDKLAHYITQGVMHHRKGH
jgi:two-component system chemotaxis response regulator CheY